jgi:hypothetical protein
MMIYYLASESQLSETQGMGFQFYRYKTTEELQQEQASAAPGTTIDRYTLDTTGDCIRIFNNLSTTELENLINDQNLHGFEEYFEKLSWWSYSDISDSVSTAKAFGSKDIVSLLDIQDNNYADSNQKVYKKLPCTYFLKPGMNIIVFKDSGKFEFFAETDVSGALRLSDIDSILYKATETGGVTGDVPDLGLNLSLLDYRYYNQNIVTQRIRTNKTAYQLLYDIKLKDSANEFYYNCPLQTATAIDINTSLTGDQTEKLSNTKFWYDPNNINNKFVISELDADALRTGLAIAKASKL